MGEQQVVQQEVLGGGRGLGVEHVLTKGPRADGACTVICKCCGAQVWGRCWWWQRGERERAAATQTMQALQKTVCPSWCGHGRQSLRVSRT